MNVDSFFKIVRVVFSEIFMHKNDIPTAKYASFKIKEFEKGLSYLKTLSPPYVLKANGLAAGKGVVILDNLTDAERELKEMLIEKKFGEASNFSFRANSNAYSTNWLIICSSSRSCDTAN